MSKNTKMVKIIAFLFLLVLALAWLFPLIWGVFTSFKSETEIKTMGFHMIPVKWVLDNYIKVIWNKKQLSGNTMVFEFNTDGRAVDNNIRCSCFCYGLWIYQVPV